MADKKKSPARETVKELRELSVEELSTKLADQRKELLDARFKHSTSQL